jgi:hypothetical protein
MVNLKSELVHLKMQINSHYGTERISTSRTMKRISVIKKKLRKIQVRKSKILSIVLSIKNER